MDRKSLIIVTCLVTAAATTLTGIFTNAPIAMAPGMGLNAFLTYSLVKAGKTDWQTALGIVFLASLLCFILTLLGLRKKLVEAIPASLIAAISVGIGLFITFIGLVHMGIIVNNEDTLISAGPLKNTALIALAGLLVMAFLETRKIKGALLAGIIISTILAIIFRLIPRPESLVSFNLDISPVAFKLNIKDAFEWGLLGSIFTLMFMDLFDSIGTLVACCHEAKMEDAQGKIKGLDRLLGIDASASMLGAALGSSTITSYIESAAGIEEGGRTGLTAVVCGLCFLLAIPFAPLVGVVPDYATGPALVMVGLFMIREVKRINFTSMEEGFPAFIIMIMIALSYSISTGLAFGFLSYVVIKIFTGKAGHIKFTMWIIALLCLVFLMLDKIPELIKLFTPAQ